MAEASTADLMHVDVMDNHFVPNLTFGFPVVQRLAQVSAVPLDLHLMIEDADKWAPRYAEIGVASCTFHWEAAKNAVQVARDIRSTGAHAAVAIKPGTPAEAVFDLLTEVDMVLVMTVEPGAGGQSFMRDMLPKLGALKRAAAEAGTELLLEVDGGISVETINESVLAGADTFVAGSSVFGQSDRAAAIAALRAAVR